jgi:hypothetical protein
MRAVRLRLTSFMLLGLCAALPGAQAAPKAEARDLYLGEAWFEARQGDWFEAISRLDTELGQYRRLDEPGLDPLHLQAGHAEFSVGDFELSYRMHQRAGRAIRAVLEGSVAAGIRNEAAYRLARIHFEKGEAVAALDALQRIEGRLPEHLRDEEQLLRAQVYIATGRLPEAVEILEELKGAPGFEGFAGYNLGVTLIQQGREAQGLEQLDRTGALKSDDEATLAIRDKANLVLGYRLLQGNKAGDAKQYLDRVRLSGPFSDKALLGSGWSDVAQGRFDRALVPWSLLVRRNATDKAVQESLLGVPYAYARLDMHGRAALLYGAALESFDSELLRLDASVASIGSGAFLKALTREEIKQDRNWVIKLRELPQAPETWYLAELMASNDFQSSLQNYLDLEDLRRRLVVWERDLDAFEDLTALRRRYYEPLLPAMDARFRALDAQLRLRLGQRESLDKRLHQLLVAPRPELLMTAEERVLGTRLGKLAARCKGRAGAECERVRRLQGVLRWDIHTNYDQRLTDAWQHLRALDADVAQMQKRHDSFVRARQAATQGYAGYDGRIRQNRERLKAAQERVALLMTQQGHLLERMAVQELEQRRRRLEEYQVQARFAMAESYDRAIKAQQGGEGRK